MRISITLLASCFLITATYSQLFITDSLTAGAIADLLQGNNLTISNVQIGDCAPMSMGQFNGTTEIPIPQGLLLTTGSAMAVADSAVHFASTFSNMPGDPDLDAELFGETTVEACALSFDCVPIGDTLLFNFAFGSEEYPEFVMSSFNDIFAIYLSGPGYVPQQNVAALPDHTPVSINNVNADVNAAYYHDNLDPPGAYVVYDGFTTNLTAFAVVTPGETYHFKVAIADVGDAIFDSGVLLEAFSFRSMGTFTGVHDASLPHGLSASIAGDMLQIKYVQHDQLGALAWLIDASGRIARTFRIDGDAMNVEVGDLSAGLYTLRVEGSSGAVMRKVMRL